MFHKMPFILMAVILSIVSLDQFIPLEVKSSLYALSLTIKSAIIFVLPFIIFMLLFKTLSQIASHATKIIFLVLVGVCVSNFLSTMISYTIGSAVYQLDLSLALPNDTAGLAPMWNFTFPKLFANDLAMFSGVIMGILFSLFNRPLADKISSRFETIVNIALRCVIYVIPFFIAGFVIKLIHDKVLQSIIQDYALIFAIVGLAQFTYIAFIYLAASQFRIRQFLGIVKNMLPAAISGFGSMSSAASMPLTIIGTEKNTKNPNLTRLVIPATVNVHLIGDCFAIPIFAFAVMKNFGMMEPAFSAYVVFALYFVLAKFSVAAVPGGGILVMLPILESHLGFTGEMASLITALYILFDPVITCANVFGNGAFALALSRLQGLFQTDQQSSEAWVGQG